jgi:hypothetical protein
MGKMAHGVDKQKSRENRIKVRRLLLHEWDPIGVGHAPEASDEYDRYADKAYVMLMDDDASASQIADYLYDVATRYMGLSASDQLRERSTRVAARLLSLKEVFSGDDERDAYSKDESDWVVISDGRSSVRLKAAGAPDALGYPTSVQIEAGPMKLAFEYVADAWVYPFFRDQLKKLSSELSGTAAMGNAGDDIHLAFSGDGRGAIGVKAKINYHSPSIHIDFEMQIDQSYLPKIIDSLEAEFNVAGQSISKMTN